MKMMTVELPLEIIADILSRLPVDSIIKCKLVCKTWRTLIDKDPLFLDAYNNITGHRQSSLPNSITEEVDEAEAQPSGFFMITEPQLFCYGEFKQDHLKVTRSIKYPPLPPRHPPYYKKEEQQTSAMWALVGSSNGLICLSATRFEKPILTCYIYVYNPMTREFVVVGTETHKVIKNTVGGCRASGFGYIASTNEYKVVRINYETCNSTSGQVKVYTLGSDGACRSWRDKGEIPYEIDFAEKPGVLVNGALYWITIDRNILSFDLDDDYGGFVTNILSFDLEDEEFRIVPKPMQGYRQLTNARLGVLTGCLSMAGTNNGYVQSTGRTDVWVMNSNKLYKSNSSSSSSTTTATPADDVKQYSWVKLPVILYPSPISPRVFNEMSSYGLKYESFCRFNYLKRIVGLFLVPYTKSFVSLKALGEDNVNKIQ